MQPGAWFAFGSGEAIARHQLPRPVRDHQDAGKGAPPGHTDIHMRRTVTLASACEVPNSRAAAQIACAREAPSGCTVPWGGRRSGTCRATAVASLCASVFCIQVEKITA